MTDEQMLALVGWDQEAADRDAWNNLKARFHAYCPDPENWDVNEETRGLYNRKTGQGINSSAYINWREIRRQAEAMSA